MQPSSTSLLTCAVRVKYRLCAYPYPYVGQTQRLFHPRRCILFLPCACRTAEIGLIMALPNTPKRSQNPNVIEMCEFTNLSVKTLAEFIDIRQITDIARNHPQGVLLLVENDYLNKCKVTCLNGLSLHHSVIEDCLIEVILDGRRMWKHYLNKVQYFNFYPCDRSEDIDILKDDICSHLASLLLEDVRVRFSRATEYFFEVRILEMP
jgi:hypothetical protein